MTLDTVACLEAYLTDRAKIEGVPFEVDFDFLLDAYLEGPSHIMGIRLCSCCGALDGDDQEPYPGYFEKWFNGDFHQPVPADRLN